MRLLILAAVVFLACSPMAGAQDAWPDLPTTGFVSGRAASQEDVDIGQAGFAIGNRAGAPLAIEIPQYAYFNDGEARIPVVLIQAEEAQGKQLAAARTADGTIVVGLLSDFTLLGSKPPSEGSSKPGAARASD